MKKESSVVKETKNFIVLKVVNNVAIIKENVLIGLADFSNNDILVEPCFTSYLLENGFFILEKGNYVSIYDTKDKKFIIKDFYRFYFNIAFSNPMNHKYYLFDSKFNCLREFDSIKHIENGSNEYFLVVKDKLYGLYKMGEGFIESVKYKNISQVSYDKLLFMDDNRVFYGYINENGFKKSKYYERIEKEGDVLYCYGNDDVEVIRFNSKDIVPLFDKVLLRGFREYIVLKDGKYGIYNNLEKKFILDIGYDYIQKDKDSYIIYLNNKKGIYNENCYFDCKYDDIVNDNYIYLYHDHLCDVVYGNQIIVKDCEIRDIEGDNIVFKKDNKYGLICINSDNDVKVFEGYDKIIKDELVYNLDQDDKNVIVYGGCIIEDCIKYRYVKESNCFYGKVNNVLKVYRGNKLIDQEEYDEIEFYDDFIKVTKDLRTVLLDYKRLDCVFSCGVNSKIVCLDNSLYVINGKYYFYKDNGLIPLISKEYEIYKTVYTSDNIVYEITSGDREEYEKLCNFIDSSVKSEDLLEEMVELENYKKNYSNIKLERKLKP